VQTIRDIPSDGPVSGVIAVSVEPEGGSPSGAPTGPVIYTGRLIPVE
jgi:anti-sigma-K factor RskA